MAWVKSRDRFQIVKNNIKTTTTTKSKRETKLVISYGPIVKICSRSRVLVVLEYPGHSCPRNTKSSRSGKQQDLIIIQALDTLVIKVLLKLIHFVIISIRFSRPIDNRFLTPSQLMTVVCLNTKAIY